MHEEWGKHSFCCPGLVQVKPLCLPLAPTHLNSLVSELYMLRLLMALNDNLYQILMIDCIVFVCEFIDLDSCLVGPRRYPEQFLCLTSDY